MLLSGKLPAGEQQPGLRSVRDVTTLQTEGHRQASISSGAQENASLGMDRISAKHQRQSAQNALKPNSRPTVCGWD